jgi:methyl-accepting chemotaxis protein
MNHETIEMVCIALGAAALAMQTVVLVAIYIGASKAIKQMKQELDEVRKSVMPMVENTREMLGHTREAIVRLTPKLESTVTDFAELAQTLRSQAADIEVAVDQILVRVRNQTSRIDTMFSGTLDAVDKASTFVAETVSKPVRQLSGLLASVKAIVESLRASDPSYREQHVNNDKDMFV